jgi:Ferric reductase NAD binding domain
MISTFGKDSSVESPYLPVSFQPPLPRDPIVRSPKDNDVEAVDDDAVASTRIFQSRFYMTSVRDKSEFDSAGIAPDIQKNLFFNRPDVKDILDSVKKLVEDEGLFHRVAVLTCGPQGMVNEVDDYCRKSRMTCSTNSVLFDCHKEIFNF